jgi:5'-nucleotidase
VGIAYREMHATSAPVAGAAPSGRLAAGSWLRIITTNDFHGALEPRRDSSGVSRGGAAWMSREIARARGECRLPNCRSILVDGGDLFQGTPASNFAFGRPVVELFNRLGYAATALGNHEFDWGQDTLRARMRDAAFPILGANVLDREGRDVPWIPDDTVVDVAGLRVGIVGVADVATPKTTRAANVADLQFADPAPVIDAHARALRARGAQAVVVVVHMGAFCDRPAGTCTGEVVEMARRLTERVDAIVSGHTHSAVSMRVNGVPIVQARTRGTTVGVVDLPLDGAAEPVVELRDVIAEGAPPDAGVDSLVRRATGSLADRMQRPIVEIAERLGTGINDGLGNLIADAQRAAGHADVAVMNAGGVRAPLDAGMATYGALFEVQPFANMLVRLSVGGRELREYLERIVARERLNAHVSGVVVHYDPRRPAGSRIIDVKFADGRSLEDGTRYTLVMSDFLAAGGDGLSLSAGATGVEDLKRVDLDALIDYLRSQPSPVRGPRDQRLIPIAP